MHRIVAVTRLGCMQSLASEARDSRNSPPPLVESFGIMSDMPNEPAIVHSDPEILGGTPVFVGTRVPFRALVDYIEGGHPLAEFLEDFPSVSREQAIAALEQAKELLIAHSAR